ncbi:MAG: hypothetical protein E6Q97_26725 [Desulfurellales bacterium]|nr:MAG: hypothetical protein E6Q97_26725 [Desulfurellales bacterium]
MSDVAKICGNCRHWFPRVGAGNVGSCRRFPATVTTKPSELCGEWQPAGPDLRTRDDIPPLALKADESILRDGLEKAVAAVEKVKKGGRR